LDCFWQSNLTLASMRISHPHTTLEQLPVNCRGIDAQVRTDSGRRFAGDVELRGLGDLVVWPDPG